MRDCLFIHHSGNSKMQSSSCLTSSVACTDYFDKCTSSVVRQLYQIILKTYIRIYCLYASSLAQHISLTASPLIYYMAMKHQALRIYFYLSLNTHQSQSQSQSQFFKIIQIFNQSEVPIKRPLCAFLSSRCFVETWTWYIELIILSKTVLFYLQTLFCSISFLAEITGKLLLWGRRSIRLGRVSPFFYGHGQQQEHPRCLTRTQETPSSL